MRTFEYARAATLDDAPGLVAGDHAPLNGSRFLAGGTDLLTLMKADIVRPSLLVDIKRAEGLPRGIEQDGDAVLGALTTLREIERHPAIVDRYPALAEAVGLAATPQLRNMATIGGNLLQRPRCWYFRAKEFDCWLKGGDVCHARDGENQQHALFAQSPCVAVHPSDAASALVALDATVRLRGGAGERSLAVADLFAEPTGDRRIETVIRSDEVLVDVRLPASASGARSTYRKAMDRKVWAFALVGVAAVVRLDGDSVADAHIVLSGVAPIPWRARAAEQAIVGQQATPERIAAAAEAAVAGAEPLEHNGYKVLLARNLVRQALTDLAGR